MSADTNAETSLEAANGLEDDFESREMCPDDACIGLLNAEGICKECGAISENPHAEERSAPVEHDVDLRRRTLCADGACTGILGADGRCKECGRVGSAVLTDPRLRGLKSEKRAESGEHADLAADASEPVNTPPAADSDSSPTSAEGTPDVPPNESPAVEALAQPPGFAERQLCPDGACIGVIGKAGTCNECGAVA